MLAFLFARIFVEPQIARAIAYEDGVGAAHEAVEAAAGHAHAHSHGEAGGGFSRAIQTNIGMGLGVLLFSVAIGALFAVVFAVAYGRVGDISARLLSVYVAGGMLVSLYVVPFLKYPASPPALSLDETIRQRTLLYLLMVVLSGALLVGAVILGRRLVGRLGGWNATLVAAGVYVVARRRGHARAADHRRDAGTGGRRRGDHPSTAVSPPTCSTTSGWPRWAHRSSSTRLSGWCSARWHRGCSVTGSKPCPHESG